MPDRRLERALSWVLPAVLLAGVATVAVRTSGQVGRADAAQELYPRAPGTTWVYANTTDGKPSGFEWDQVVGTAQLAEQLVDVVESRWENFLGRGAPHTSRRYLSVAGNRLLDHGTRSGGSFSAAEPPMPILDVTGSAGDVVTWRGTTGDDDASLTLTTVGVETVEAGGRSYAGCLHTRTVQKVSGSRASTDTYDAWSCPGVGPVRSEERFTSASLDVRLDRELVALQSPTESFRTEDAPTVGPGDLLAADAVEPAGTTSDLGPARANAVAGRLDLSRWAWTDVRREEAAYAPVAAGSRMVVADERAVLTSSDVRTGEVEWRVRLSPPLVASPTWAGGAVLVADASKSLHALEGATGATLWVAHFDDVASAPPVVVDGVVVVPIEDGTVVGLDAASGDPRWTISLDARAYRPPATDGTSVFVGDINGSVVALRPQDGSRVWSVALDGATAAGPSVTGESVVVADEGGYVRSLSTRDGSERWKGYGDRTATTSAAAAGDAVALVMDFDQLEVRDGDTGDVRWRRDLPESVRVPPVVVGDEVVVVDGDATLLALSLRTGAVRERRSLGRPDMGSASGRVPMGTVDGHLVIPIDHRSAGGVTLYAYPLAAGPASGGRLAMTTVSLPAPPLFPASGDTDDFVFTARGGDIWSVRRGAARQVADDTLSPYAIRAGGLTLFQVETELRAVDTASGKVRWTAPMSDSVPSTIPVVAGDRVVVPVRGLALVAYDLASGDPVWARSVPEVTEAGGTTPLVLAGGDVVYGGTSLNRFDGRTGERRWRSETLLMFAPLAADDSAVFAAGYRDDRGLLTALDAESGEPLWEQDFDPSALQGPTVVGSSVVAIDAGEVLRAFDTRTGRPLWSHRLQSEPGGSPVALDGAVAVVEKGFTEDLEPDNHRTLVLDPRTGRLLGARETLGNDYGLAGAGLLGRALLVPSFGRGAIGELTTLERR